MELILNFIWMLISVLLVAHWLRVTPRASGTQVMRALVALLLLIVVLLPIISATDDLYSMAGLLEGEHSEHVEHVVRRGEMPMLDVHYEAGLFSLAALALLFFDLSFLTALRSRLMSRSQPVRQLDGFARTFGTRPPPAALFATA